MVVSREEAEIVRARLLELFPEGIEEVDAREAVELVVYTDDLGEARLRQAFGQVSSEAVAPGWEDRWRDFHRPVRAGGLWLGPPWQTPPQDEPAVIVDPGRAFGTGAHPTTRACIELLAGLERGSLLDAGCGSGVLAVAAVRLGFAPVLALDVDPTAVAAARNTARQNGVSLSVRQADVLRDDLAPADVVVANVELRLVEALLGRLHGGVAVTSGYLADEAPNAPGWEVMRRVELEGWAAHALAPTKRH